MNLSPWLGRRQVHIRGKNSICRIQVNAEISAAMLLVISDVYSANYHNKKSMQCCSLLKYNNKKCITNE